MSALLAGCTLCSQKVACLLALLSIVLPKKIKKNQIKISKQQRVDLVFEIKNQIKIKNQNNNMSTTCLKLKNKKY